VSVSSWHAFDLRLSECWEYQHFGEFAITRDHERRPEDGSGDQDHAHEQANGTARQPALVTPPERVDEQERWMIFRQIAPASQNPAWPLRPRTAAAAMPQSNSSNSGFYLSSHERRTQNRQTNHDGKRPQHPPPPAAPARLAEQTDTPERSPANARPGRQKPGSRVPNDDRDAERQHAGTAGILRCVGQRREKNGEKRRVVVVQWLSSSML